MTGERKEISKAIKKLARRIGFTDCGIIPARAFTDDSHHFQKWLRLGMHAGMNYLENHFEKRTDPSKLVPGAKSVIVLLLNYLPAHAQSEENENLIISKYAYGQDYHQVMKGMLQNLLQAINKDIAPCTGRVFVDSAPILERAAARSAGLGWIGKNSNLISPTYGSFLFIGELIVDLQLEYDNPIPDYCGACTRCIDSCPTKALTAPHRLDSRKCISYWTIEHKGEIDLMLRGKFNNRIFGCDICQDVCPWNRKARPNKISEFRPSNALFAMNKINWHNLKEEEYEQLFSDTAVMRTGYDGLTRNIKFVTSGQK
jgi:epoxyqueuosine reductase